MEERRIVGALAAARAPIILTISSIYALHEITAEKFATKTREKYEASARESSVTKELD